MITIIGLGVGDSEQNLNLAAIAKMKEADEVLFRTAAGIMWVLDAFDIPYGTLDFLYEKCRNYDTLTRAIVREVRKRGKGRNICYCVDGSPLEDRAARILMQGREKVCVIDGISKSSHAALLAGVEGGYTALSAFDIAQSKLALPLVVYDVTADIVGDIKLILAERFGDEAPACFIRGGSAKKIALYEADRQDTYEGAALVLYDTSLLEKKRFDFDDFVAILKRLRAPDGCPWDRVQTHESIRINGIEEMYELVDAIDRKDIERMLEETGDVLMQSVFHALIEEERGSFTVSDMVTAVCEKLISRHTHVFGQDKATGADSALSVWEKNKMKEKHQVTFSDAVNDVPECFPALLRAQKIAKRMEKGGWDAATIENFERKFREEYAELMAARETGDEKAIMEELGDVLFCAVELGRAVKGDCEQALLDTVKKVQKRYTAYEAMVLADGKDVLNLTDEEKEEYYKRAKYAAL